MATFRAFLEAIDTPGGHLFLLLFVCGGGAALGAVKIPHGEDILHDGFIALITILSTRRNSFNAQPDSNMQINSNPNQPLQEHKES